jgi:hypothetical protein
MGFKLTRPLTANVNNIVALPSFTTYADADDIWTEFETLMPGVIAELDYLDPATDTYIPYLGFDFPPFSTNFTIDATKMFHVNIKVNSNANWIIVGSNNDTQAYTFIANVNNFYAVPYHTTATDAAAIWASLGPNVAELDAWDPATDSYIPYLGFDFPPFSTNFPIVPGQAINVKCGATIPGYVPAHY